MYRIYCDETWTANYIKCPFPCYVFYGVMVKSEHELDILNEIEEFKHRKGLYSNNHPIEIKWKKAEEEWKNSRKINQKSRYEDLLEIFFRNLIAKKISFAYMYVSRDEYERVENEFLELHPENRHNFFFMLYFQFLYHTFIKNQVKQNQCEIFIDDHDMGAEGRSYDINTLRNIINWKINREFVPKNQLWLDSSLSRKIQESISLVDLQNSKTSPLIQLSDLCAGCVRQVLESTIPPPEPDGFLPLVHEEVSQFIPSNGKENLAHEFYRGLRRIKNYRDIDLAKASYHYRFCIFPFRFSS
jgi:hypothetical protein